MLTRFGCCHMGRQAGGVQNAGIQDDGIRCHASVIRVKHLSKVCKLGKDRFAAFVRVTLIVKHIL